MPGMAYIYYNLGNLRCLSNAYPEAIGNYTYAIQLYPYFGEAFYNRGLLHIYLRETEKGCLDISKAGELGIDDAYSVIRKYCVKKDNL
jgi:tetratricopeptide (TPR) repeat protein